MTTVPNITPDAARKALRDRGYTVSDDGETAQCPTHDYFDGDELALRISAEGRSEDVVLECGWGCPLEGIVDMLGLGIAPSSTPEEGQESPTLWPPLEAFDSDLPALPLDGLPPVLRNIVVETAEAFQVPSDMVLNHAIGILSSAPYGTVQCEVRKGWIVPLQLATLSLTRSGEKKSPTNNVLKKPIAEVEKDRRKRDVAARIRHKAAVEIQSAKVEALKLALRPSKNASAAPGADGRSPEDEYLTEKIKLDMMESPQLRWASIMDDVTPEALGVRLGNTYTGAGLILSDETSIFAHAVGSGRGASKSDKAKVYLQAISGVTIDSERVTREGEYAESPALSIAAMLQPELYERIIRSNPELVSSGLIPRFLLVNPKSRVGSRKSSPDPVSDETLQAWCDAVTRICKVAEEYVEAHLEEQRKKAESDPTAIHFTEQVPPRLMEVSRIGQAYLDIYAGELEPQLKPQGRLESITSWCSKSPTFIAQIAALFTLLDDPWSADVDDKYFPVAEGLIKGYTRHQLMLAGVPVEATAEQVWIRLKEADESKFDENGCIKRRDVQRLIQNQGWFKNAELSDKQPLLLNALEVLEARGYVKIVQGKRKDTYLIKRRPDWV